MEVIHENPKDKPTQFTTLKEENKILRLKLADCEKKLTFYDKQQAKIKELEKINFDNSTRLLQCVSNVRDLLHSNKQLRQELERQKKCRQNLQNKLKEFQKHILPQKINKTSHLQKLPQINQEPESIVFSSHRKVHKLSKIQKFSKLKLNSQRYSTDHIEHQNTSPARNTKDALKHLNYSHGIVSNEILQQSQSHRKRKVKLGKSMQTKKEEQRYLKAKLKRKLSLRQSEDRLETLQCKPQIKKIETSD